MKLLITGSRDGHRYVECAIDAFIAEYGVPDEFILGCARGVDRQARDLCRKRNYNHAVFVASWKKYGFDAGPIRNARMVQDCKENGDDMFLAFPLGRSPGTRSCIMLARAHGMNGWVLCGDGEFLFFGRTPTTDAQFAQEERMRLFAAQRMAQEVVTP
jgi:YspA, cpYpsA-related SLOG family